jgi:primosomal protein N' (replication factor Y)
MSVKCLPERSGSLGSGRSRVKMIGPADAPLAKARDIYRKIIYIKADDYSLLVETKNYLMTQEEKYGKNVVLQFNFE